MTIQEEIIKILLGKLKSSYMCKIKLGRFIDSKDLLIDRTKELSLYPDNFKSAKLLVQMIQSATQALLELSSLHAFRSKIIEILELSERVDASTIKRLDELYTSYKEGL